MKDNLALDVSLLAVLIALHVTRKNKSLELVVMALLFSHVILTTEAFLRVKEDDSGFECEPIEEPPVEEPPVEELEELEEPEAVGTSRRREKSVSDGSFDRMSFVSANSSNSELARARTSFFEELFPNK